MLIKKITKILIFICILPFLLNSCANRGDARKSPPDPKLRVKRNMEEGRGFRLMDSVNKKGSTNYEFASSNELWRASLDIIDFMPLSSANYSGGIIITDWYSDGNTNEAIKINIRFLSNEVRADSLSIKIYYRNCDDNFNCAISEKQTNLKKELMREILKKAAIYEKQTVDKNFKPYNDPSVDTTK